MTKQQQAVSDLNKKVENAPKLIEAYNQLGSRKTLIEHALPNTSDFPQIVTIMEGMGATSGVNVKAVAPALATAEAAPAPASNASGTTSGATPAPSTPAVTVSDYHFSVTVEGDYGKILNLLKNIEISARPMKVTSVSFTGNSGSVGASIQLTTYYQSAANINDQKVEVE
jgi:hypothetical protein